MYVVSVSSFGDLFTCLLLVYRLFVDYLLSCCFAGFVGWLFTCLFDCLYCVELSGLLCLLYV